MLKDLKEMTEFLVEKGYTPNEFIVLYELSCKSGFKDLSPEDQKALVDNVYREYLKRHFTSITEIVDAIEL
jgi:hypothetical protein